MDDRILWVWITQKIPPGKMIIPQLLEYYGGIKEIYDEKTYDGINLDPVTKAALKNKSLDAAYEICSAVNQANARILVYDDEKYPELLRHIDSPPYVLYVKGRIIDWDRYLLISIVGTREYSKYGLMATAKLAGELSKRGVVIVSGLARGLDAAATNEALKHNCYTIGVIGCNIDKVYPAENRRLFEALEKTGLIISEYPPGAHISKLSFPLRNRIMAGISRGVLVTEAPKKSGALITARLASEYGRDVYAVPGSIFEPTCIGSNRLLQGSAKCTSSAQDIIDEYPDAEQRLRVPMGNVFIDDIPEILLSESRIDPKPSEQKKPKEKPAPEKDPEAERLSSEPVIPEGLSDNEMKIVLCLLSGEKHKDEIIRESGLEAGCVNTTLVLLEMNGTVTALPSNKYKLK